MLIPVPTNDFIPILSALGCAHNILVWAKTITSLNLYLFEKVYLLVFTQLDLRESYNLRLGEMLKVFVVIFAISKLIDKSGLGNIWQRLTD